MIVPPMHTIITSILVAFLTITAPATAQDAEPTAPAQPVLQASPRQTIELFLINMRNNPSEFSKPMQRATECLDLEGYTVASEVGPKAARVLYQRLTTLNLQPDDFPNAQSVDGTTTNQAIYAKSLDIAFIRDETGAWRVQRDTLDTLLAEHAAANPPITKRALDAVGLAPISHGVVFGLETHQWLGLFLVIAIGVVIDFTVRIIATIFARRLIRRKEEDRPNKDTAKLLKRSVKPIGLMVAGIVVYTLLNALALPPDPEAILRTAARAFALIAGVTAAYRLVDLLAEYFQHKAAKTSTKFDDLLVPLVRKAAKVFVVAFGLVFLAESFHLPITSLVAGLGIGGLAFAFAAKDTIENLFGSVAVILDHPFSVGDWIVVDDVEGTVEDLGFRSTRIRTFYNSIVTVPNAILVRAKVDNYGRRRYRRFKTHITIAYDTPPNTIEAFCEGIREIIRNHPVTRKDFFEVHLNALADHSLNILLYMFFATSDWSVELRERHRLIMDIIRLANELDVEFAFPTQTIHLYNEENPPPGTPSNTDPTSAGIDAARRILAQTESQSG